MATSSRWARPPVNWTRSKISTRFQVVASPKRAKVYKVHMNMRLSRTVFLSIAGSCVLLVGAVGLFNPVRAQVRQVSRYEVGVRWCLLVDGSGDRPVDGDRRNVHGVFHTCANGSRQDDPNPKRMWHRLMPFLAASAPSILQRLAFRWSGEFAPGGQPLAGHVWAASVCLAPPSVTTGVDEQIGEGGMGVVYRVRDMVWHADTRTMNPTVPRADRSRRPSGDPAH